jgi:2-polyprenyl-6-methoxyphenol hydroxylase-like FAD-dependent oxidoreductase
VVLVGDAAYAPSFLSGQGSSIALVGAYVLAGELATHADPVEAFTAYERIARPFVEANQALAGSGRGFLLPRTPEELDARNQALVAAQSSGQKTELRRDTSRLVHSSLCLPDYGHAMRG